MKKILLASILMAIGAPAAHATAVLGDVICEGSGANRSCNGQVTCDNGTCAVDFIALDSRFCIGIPLNESGQASYNLIASREQTDPDPVCAWDVTDGDGTVRIVIDSSDGLPVELQSLSVE